MYERARAAIADVGYELGHIHGDGSELFVVRPVHRGIQPDANVWYPGNATVAVRGGRVSERTVRALVALEPVCYRFMRVHFTGTLLRVYDAAVARPLAVGLKYIGTLILHDTQLECITEAACRYMGTVFHLEITENRKLSRLPMGVGREMLNLETLRVRDCGLLRALPPTMCRLQQLSHITWGGKVMFSASRTSAGGHQMGFAQPLDMSFAADYGRAAQAAAYAVLAVHRHRPRHRRNPRQLVRATATLVLENASEFP